MIKYSSFLDHLAVGKWSERREEFVQTEEEFHSCSLGDLTGASPILSSDYKSVDYLMELHKEIERLKTEKLMLLRDGVQTVN